MAGSIKISLIPCLLVSLMLLNSCEKTDNYYQMLDNQPEVLNSSYNKVYSVGDTLIMQGRLNPQNNLVIHIGNADARIISADKVTVQVTGVAGLTKAIVDQVKLLVSADMGIGSNRPVLITSAGNTVNAPAIEIVANAQSGILPNPLKLVEHYTMQTGTVPLYCRNGTGDIYLWKPDKTITLLKPDGTVTEVFNRSNGKDSFGAFDINTFNGGGVDPGEKFLYFSVVTTDGNADNAANKVYRLCRWDIKNKQLLTLNRTLYANSSSKRTLAAAQPFEGAIDQVKIFQVTGIYPDSKGNVYFNLNNYFITRLDASNSYSYIFNFYQQTYNSFIPQILDPVTRLPVYNNFAPLILGLRIPDFSDFKAIDPDNGLMYIKNGTSNGLMQYDLANQVQLYIMPNTWSLKNTSDKIYMSGSFGILTGPSLSYNGPLPDDFGYLPMPDQKLLILMYQNLENQPNGVWKPVTPVWEVLDFKQKRGDRYAPGKLVLGAYQMTTDDILLNYDKDGTVYTTANSKSFIVKTTAQ